MTRRLLVVLVVVVLTSSSRRVWSEENLLRNADCEDAFTSDDWRGNGADLLQDDDAYTGIYSCRLTNT